MDRLQPTTVGEFGLGVQAWTGPTAPDPARVNVALTQYPRPKPYNGFFTSTWDSARRSSAWLDFMRTNGRRNAEGRQLWTFVPDPTTTLLIINSEDDYPQLAHRYPHRYPNERDPRCAPHWFEIAAADSLPFEAVHVTAEAAAELDGWDVESTAWFVLRFTSSECMGAITEDWTLTRT